MAYPGGYNPYIPGGGIGANPGGYHTPPQFLAGVQHGMGAIKPIAGHLSPHQQFNAWEAAGRHGASGANLPGVPGTHFPTNPGAGGGPIPWEPPQQPTGGITGVPSGPGSIGMGGMTPPASTNGSVIGTHTNPTQVGSLLQAFGGQPGVSESAQTGQPLPPQLSLQGGPQGAPQPSPFGQDPMGGYPGGGTVGMPTFGGGQQPSPPGFGQFPTNPGAGGQGPYGQDPMGGYPGGGQVGMPNFGGGGMGGKMPGQGGFSGMPQQIGQLGGKMGQGGQTGLPYQPQGVPQ